MSTYAFLYRFIEQEDQFQLLHIRDLVAIVYIL